jgi:hypothetical protein
LSITKNVSLPETRKRISACEIKKNEYGNHTWRKTNIKVALILGGKSGNTLPCNGDQI